MLKVNAHKRLIMLDNPIAKNIEEFHRTKAQTGRLPRASSNLGNRQD